MNKGKISKIIAALIFCLLVTTAVVIVGVSASSKGKAQISVTFDGNSGYINSNASVTESIDNDSLVSDLDRFIPSKVGYNFVGWATDAEGKNMLSKTDKLSSDMTIYAIWEIQQVTLTYELNGGNGSIAPVTVDYGSQVTVYSGEGVTKKNYNFTGWYVDEECKVQANEKIVMTGDTKLYAGWIGSVKTVKIYDYDFEAAGEYKYVQSGDAISSRYGNKIDLTSFEDETHYTFQGFYAEPQTDLLNVDADKLISATEKYIVSSDDETISLYAVYLANTYTIKCDNEELASYQYGQLDEQGHAVKFVVRVGSLDAKVGYVIRAVDGDVVCTNGQELDADRNYNFTTSYVARDVSVVIITHNDATDHTQTTDTLVTSKYGAEFDLSSYNNSDAYDSYWTIKKGEVYTNVTGSKVTINNTNIEDMSSSNFTITFEYCVDTTARTISFLDKDGNEIEGKSESVNFNAEYTTIYTVAELREMYAKTGYDLKSVTMDGEVVELGDDETSQVLTIAKVTKNIEVGVSDDSYEAQPRTIKIYDYNFDSIEENKYEYQSDKDIVTKYDEEVTLTSFDNKTHYVFRGYYTEPQADLLNIDADKLISATEKYLVQGESEEVKLYAVYEAKEYTLTIDGVVAERIKYGEKIDGTEELKQFELKTEYHNLISTTAGYNEANYRGYNIDGYTLEGSSIPDGTKLDVNKNYTYNSNKTPRPVQVTIVKYVNDDDINEGTNVVVEGKKFGDTIDLTTAEYQNSTSFRSTWSVDLHPDAEIKDGILTLNEKAMDTSDDTLIVIIRNVAKHIEKTITIANSGETPITLTASLNTSFTIEGDDLSNILAACARDGYTIDYFTDVADNQYAVEGNRVVITKVTDDMTLTAHYEARRYNITYKYWVDSTSTWNTFVVEDEAKKTIKYGDKFDNLFIDSSRPAFIGWSRDKEGTDVVLVTEAMDQVEDIDLYAIYNYTYTFDNNGVVTGFAEGKSTNDVVIPEYYRGLVVTEIAANAFKDNTTIVSVVLNYVIIVGDNAFKGCTALTTVDGTEDLVSIGASAFENTIVTSLTISSDETTIGNRAFANTKITAVYIGADAEVILSSESVMTYGGYELGDKVAFVNSSIENIGEEIFADCTELVRVEVGNSVTKLNNGMFKNCTALTTTHSLFTSNIEDFGEYTFEDTSIVNGRLVFNANVAKVSKGAFKGVTTITRVDFSNVIPIEANAFKDCTALKYSNISIFSTTKLESNLVYINEIGEEAFRGTAIEYIDIEGDAETSIVIGKNAFANSKIISVDIYYDLEAKDTDGVKTAEYHSDDVNIVIGAGAFAGLDAVTINFGEEGTALDAEIKALLFGENDKITDENA